MNYPPPNQFLDNLFNKSNGLLRNCGSPVTIIILAPVSSSLNAIDSDTRLVYSDNLTDEFMQSHILRIPRLKDGQIERSKARVYASVNGKTMVVKDDTIFPHRGFRGVHEVKLLHDSLLWPDDPRSGPYLVFFLDRPLMGSPIPTGVWTVSTLLKRPRIRTWSALTEHYTAVGVAVNYVFKSLCADFKHVLEDEENSSRVVNVSSAGVPGPPPGCHRARSRRSSQASIVLIPLERTNTSLSFSDSSILQFLRVQVDLVVTSAAQAFQALPLPLLQTIGVETQLEGGEVENMIELFILNELYDTIFPRLVLITRQRDDALTNAIKQCRHADISQLGAVSSQDLRHRHTLALARFQGFGKLQDPREKIAALLSTINVLMRNSEKSSDDLIPCLVSVVLKANVRQLYASILWVKEFAMIDVDSGETGFALSTLEAVLYHITSSAQNLKQVSNANKAFFSAILSKDEILARRLIDGDPDLLQIRNLDNCTPHQLADVSLLGYFLTKTCTACNMSQLLMSHLDDECTDDILSAVLSLESRERQYLLNEVDNIGQSIAHRIYEIPDRLVQICHLLDWQLQDRQGNSPLQVLARIYDHPLYETLFARILEAISRGSDDNQNHYEGNNMLENFTVQQIRLEDHIDAKGNTLAHIVSGDAAMLAVLTYCTGDFNRLNDKGLTPLLIAIKFGRLSTLKILVGRSEIRTSARDSRGHSPIHYVARGSLEMFEICVQAGFNVNERSLGSGMTPLHVACREGNIPIIERLLELQVEDAWDWRGYRAGDIVKNDQVRSIMDTWACRNCEVRVLRGHVGEDCTVKYLIKSKSGGGVLRSVSEFIKLRTWMTNRYPAVGVAELDLNFPDPCQLHSRPARSALLALTARLDAFVQSLLDIECIREDPIVWEFLLSPTTNDQSIISTIEGKIELQKEEIWNSEKFLTFYESTETFFKHAKEQVRMLVSNYNSLERRARALKDAQLHISVAYGLIGISLDPFAELKAYSYTTILESLSDALVPKEPSLIHILIEDVVSTRSRIQGLLESLCIPDDIIERMSNHMDDMEYLGKELIKNPRVQLKIPMLLNAQSRRKDSIKHTLIDVQRDLRHTGSELRYYETVLADNLSLFYSAHERRAKDMIRNFVKMQVHVEKERLDGMQRAIAGLKATQVSSD